MSTLSVRTIRGECRAEELVSCMLEQHLKIVGIQEHSRVHKDQLNFTKIQGQSFITSSAWRNEAVKAATGGVGILLSHKATKSLSSVKSHTQTVSCR